MKQAVATERIRNHLKSKYGLLDVFGKNSELTNRVLKVTHVVNMSVSDCQISVYASKTHPKNEGMLQCLVEEHGLHR